MICCTLIAAIIALPVWLARQLLPYSISVIGSPLEWRLESGEPSSQIIEMEHFSLRARAKSFKYAIDGLKTLVREEHNARIHLAASVVVIVVCIWLDINASDWRWVIAAICWVWITEAINTSLEHLCDVVSLEYHEGVRACKDIAAGAVLVSAFGAVMVGLVTLLPYLK